MSRDTSLVPPLEPGKNPASGSLSPAGVARFLKLAVAFVLVGLILYVALYAVADQLVYQYTVRNRFFAVKTAPSSTYDDVILGASHAAALDYDAMTPQLEQMTGQRIINLSVVGGGITVNRLLLEYFLAEHQTRNVVYVVDSFAFYSRQWNEDRLDDVQLINRAPFDPVLVRILFSHPESRLLGINYLVGFAKINNPDRFVSDVSQDDAVNFDTTYQPNEQIDTLRLQYLYPAQIDPAVFSGYLAQLEDLIRYAQGRGVHVTVLKPPIPTRLYGRLPAEAQFDVALKAVLARHGVAFYDFSLVGNDDRFFFNPDHLNREGVTYFFDHSLSGILNR